MTGVEQQMQQLIDQVQQLTAQVASQQQNLDATKAALDQQTQTATTALSVAQTAMAQLGQTESRKKTLNPKLVNPPDAFQGTDADWERYKFGFLTWITTVDSGYPELMKKAASQTDEIDLVEMTEADEQLSTNLFAILVGQCQAGEIPAIAMLVPDRNGFELWRRMHARFEPENKHKPYAWLRALSNPTFPTKESQWQRGLEEWEGEIAKYEREYGKDFDGDLKLAILSEVAPKALAPQIAMNSAYLTSYKAMREFIVQYLKSKNLWKRSAGTSFGSGTVSSSSQFAPNSGPVPMDVGAVDVPETKGKGKGKSNTYKNNDGTKGGKKGRSKGEGKGKEKGKDKHNPSKTSEGKGPPCAICGPIKGKSHTIEECYFNARVNPKGEGKGGKKGTSNPSVNALDENHHEAATSTIPSMLSTLQQQVDALKTLASTPVPSAPASSGQSQTNPSRKTHQGAVTTNNPNMCFAVRHAPAKAVENNSSQTDARAFHQICANQAQDMKYIMVDSGATTSCANQCSFPGAVLDPTKTKELWAINGTPIANAGEMTAGTNLTAVTTSGECKSIPATFRLDATDTTEPVMALCRILDEADCDLHFYRSSSGKSACIQTPDGNTIHLPRFGARFYLPYQDRPPPVSAGDFVAALDGDESNAPMESEDDDGQMELRPDMHKQEDVLEDLLAPMPLPSQPQTLPEPSAPTEEERKLHNLTHADFAPWCPHCVAGRGRENKHSRKNKHEDPEVPVIQFDYQFFSRDGQLVAEESRAATALTGTDTSSGWPIMIFVPHKGVDVCVVKSIMVWINRLGYNKVILQHDQEDALKTVLEQVQQKLGVDRVQLRATPRYSHQSQGGAENCNSTMAGMLRTWLSALRETYPSPNTPLDINHNIVPWLCRWVAFVWARYHIKSDNMTAFRIVTGREYTSPIVPFGEVVFSKLPNLKSINKSKPRWFKGVFVGRTESDDSAVVLTESGAITVRSIRRLPSPEQHDVNFLDSACGLPWALSGNRIKVQTESSQVVPMLPVTHHPDKESSSDSSESSDNDSPSGSGNIQAREERTSNEESPAMPNTPSYTPSIAPEEDVQGMTPPDSPVVGMTPPASPVLPPLSVGPEPAFLDTSDASPRAVPLPPTSLRRALSFNQGQNQDGNESPTKARRTETTMQPAGDESPTKKQKVGTITSALTQIQDWARNGQWENQIGSVLDLLDTQLDPREVEKARNVQMATLVEKEFAVPTLKAELPRKSKVFHYKWVDEIKRGVYRSRFTCADVKSRYSREELADETNTFAPTPYEESHVLFELKCLVKGWNSCSADVRCAYLLGKDSGDSAGNPVNMRAPPEYQQHFNAWLTQQPPHIQRKFVGVDLYKDVVLQLVGNLYGRRPAGSNYRKEFEEVVTQKLATKGYQFKRGKRDPTVYTCSKTGATILHHVDDLRVAAANDDLHSIVEGLQGYLDMKTGKIEAPGTKVNVLGRTKVRTEDAFFTLPEAKHRDNILTLLDLWHAKPSRVAGKRIVPTETNTSVVDSDRAVIYPKCVGSAIYLSIDRRDVRFEVKELARHMKDPRECDWENLILLGRYLLDKPTFARVALLNEESKTSGVLTVDGFTDSDWAGCPDTRRSTDCSIVNVGGSVVIAHPQTQPGLPATSSGEAETRALSRGARDIMYVKQLAEEDFGLKLGLPRMWTDATTALQTAKRLGAGSKMRHIDVATLYVQVLVHQKLLKVGKVAGTVNPANCLTKHLDPRLKEQCIEELGMVDLSSSDLYPMLEAAEQIELVAALLAHRPAKKTPTPWKPNFAVAADALQICIAQSVCGGTKTKATNTPTQVTP